MCEITVVRNLDELMALTKAARKSLRLSQASVARLIGRGQATLAQWETGRRDPGGAGMFDLVNALGWDVALVPRGHEGAVPMDND